MKNISKRKYLKNMSELNAVLSILDTLVRPYCKKRNKTKICMSAYPIEDLGFSTQEVSSLA